MNDEPTHAHDWQETTWTPGGQYRERCTICGVISPQEDYDEDNR